MKILASQIVFTMLFLISMVRICQAHILFQNDDFATIDSDSVVIDNDNTNTGDIQIVFGKTLNKIIQWSQANARFEISDPLAVNGSVDVSGNLFLNGNEINNARAENLSSAPTCNSGAAGRFYFDSTAKNFYYCDDTNWVAIAPLVVGQFIDGAGGTNLGGGSLVPIPFNTESRKDTGITHSTVTNNSRITLDKAGWYRVSYSVTHSNSTINVSNIHCIIRLDGTTTVIPSDTYSVDTTAFTSRATNSGTVVLQTTAANEYYELLCNNSGLSLLGTVATVANDSWTLVQKL